MSISTWQRSINCLWTFRQLNTYLQAAMLSSQPSRRLLMIGNPVDCEKRNPHVEPHLAKRKTVQELYKDFVSIFKSKDILEPEGSAECIIAHALGCQTLEGLHWERVDVSQTQQDLALRHLHQRLARMPVQYVIGEWDFRDFTLQVTPPVFIPRPETEELVGFALEDPVVLRARRFLEIGCGSGAISVALLRALPDLCAVTLDRSLDACKLTTVNAERLGVKDRLQVLHKELSNGDLPSFLEEEKFDFVISNPPYIPTSDMDTLLPEILLYEDERALCGGIDGMNVIKDILQVAPLMLQPHGSVWLETDSSHPPLIQRYLATHSQLGLAVKQTLTDFQGIPRFSQLQLCR